MIDRNIPKLGCTLALFWLPSPATPLTAQERTLRVGFSPFAPFIVNADPTRPQGFSIELWHAVAAEIGVATTWVACDNVRDKLGRLNRGEMDVALGGITITSERELDRIKARWFESY